MPRTIISSDVTSSTQVDGRLAVHEVYSDSSGKGYIYDSLQESGTDLDALKNARIAVLNSKLAQEDAIAEAVSGTLTPISKYVFRQLFTTTELENIDDFNANYESNILLSNSQKKAIRTGLEDYRVTADIPRPFSSKISDMLDIYVAMGILTSQRKTAIMEAGNG